MHKKICKISFYKSINEVPATQAAACLHASDVMSSSVFSVMVFILVLFIVIVLILDFRFVFVLVIAYILVLVSVTIY
jgi:hypothetical protein